ncbi:MAG: CBS domain-containing protein [Gemmatimonadetes bacterium]|nr:CBS domain-containing protein [Gemmatimonadota bacterium]
MKARDIMTPNPEVVTPDEPVTRAAELMRDLNVGIIPVVDDRSSMRLTGLITDRDIAVRHVAEGHQQACNVSDHMTSDTLNCVRPDADVDEVMSLMGRDQVRRIPVVESDNKLVGIIAQADLAVHEGPQHPKKVEKVLEKISEPAQPER